ncbi:hypothetical protein DFP72DRAFT_1081947 [Ephemerocybe angulata]|uniref:Uncharacterized protein n=1 Tax=Ephemerocybe angulata TaxID=980116 RepID=A0A8H6H8C7_9AGAR|nr:hypothetical protein DFP72DRAFT_1081947 [Tulosesus angulatus]
MPGNLSTPFRQYSEQRLALVGRNPRLPGIYEAFNHPLRLTRHDGRTFFEKGLQVPQGQLAELKAAGLLELKSGDYLLGREQAMGTDPSKDQVIAWVVGRRLVDVSLISGLIHAIKAALGDRETRTPDKVYMEEGATPVGKATNRSYNVATVVERPKMTVAPQANFKEGEPTPFKECAAELCKAIIPVAMANFEFAPQAIRDAIRERSEVLGLPRIGDPENYAYYTVQCNISAVKKGGRLSEQLGTVGGAHSDGHNSPGHFTNMVTYCDLPSNWHPGYFHLLGLGVFVSLENGLGFNFQGNRWHGASGPFAPESAVDVPWAYRFAGISYPPEEMVGQDCRYRIAASAGEGKEGLHLTPEMMRLQYTTDMQRGTNRALWVRDALPFMDRQSYVNFLARMTYDFHRYILNQAPEEVGLDFDNDAFFPLLSFTKEDGSRGRAEVWEHAPPVGRERALAFEATRNNASRNWEEHVERMVGMIPSRFVANESMRTVGDPLIEVPPSGDGNAIAGPSRQVAKPRKRTREDEEMVAVVRRAKRAKTERVPSSVTGEESGDESGDDSEYTEDFVLRSFGRNKNPRVPSSIPGEDSDGEGPANARATTLAAASTAPKKSVRKGKAVATRRKPAKGKAGASSRRVVKKSHDAIGKPSSNLYPFLQQSSVLQLEREVMELASERDSVCDDEDNMKEVEWKLDQACTIVKQQPLDLNNLANVSTILSCASQVQEHLLQKQYDIRVLRQSVALATLESWRWMQLTLPQMARTLQAEPRGRTTRRNGTWLHNLVSLLRRVVVGGDERIMVSASECGFTEARVASVPFHNKWARRFLQEAEIQDIVCDVVPSIVMGWMGWLNDKREKQAWFLHAIVNTLGEEVVTMGYAWTLISQLKFNDIILGPNPHRSVYPRGMEGFVQAFNRHPICDPDSQERQLYETYVQLYRGEIETSEVVLAPTDDRWSQFVDMLLTALCYVRDPARRQPPTDIPKPKFYQLLLEDSDFYLPIREKAFSRIRSRSEIGPYREGVINTASGLFSAVVWRAITFRSRFSKTHRMHFTSSDDLQRLVDDIVDKQQDVSEQFFCDKRAYGQPTARALNFHRAYWDAASNMNWEGFVLSKPTFSETVDYFKSGRQLGPNKQLFPQLGDLGRLTLVGDLAYAGVCAMPTNAELADAIVELNTGATGGLRALGYMSSQWPSMREEKVAAVEAALASLMDRIRETVGEESFVEMGMDLITLEHSLCKFSRALHVKAL